MKTLSKNEIDELLENEKNLYHFGPSSSYEIMSSNGSIKIFDILENQKLSSKQIDKIFEIGTYLGVLYKTQKLSSKQIDYAIKIKKNLNLLYQTQELSSEQKKLCIQNMNQEDWKNFITNYSLLEREIFERIRENDSVKYK